jgi:hypothetical protein
LPLATKKVSSLARLDSGERLSNMIILAQQRYYFGVVALAVGAAVS